MEEISVNGKAYKVLTLLGKGKGGYSYRVTDGKNEFVLKQIHHEPCSYYSFGDKLSSELNDYARLKAVGIPMPEMVEVDRDNERILKEFIDGKTVSDCIIFGEMKDEYLAQVREMSELLFAAKLNIDYYPTNFVERNGKLYYIDYECNDYSEQWSYDNWGVKYWSKTPEFIKAFGLTED